MRDMLQNRRPVKPNEVREYSIRQPSGIRGWDRIVMKIQSFRLWPSRRTFSFLVRSSFPIDTHAEAVRRVEEEVIRG